jgi:hypothetical protein
MAVITAVAQVLAVQAHLITVEELPGAGKKSDVQRRGAAQRQ